MLDRSTNTGYVSFENDSSIVAGVAKVFPLFFFAVAALVCITTMTRMIDEQRTQIGTLKALGYSAGTIAWKYMSYSGGAALLGCALGFALGTWIFPLFIWMGYSMLYDFAPIVYVFDGWLLIISVLAALACSAGVTWLSCHAELRENPANLMRPKAPKAGKRILLEYIPFVWNRLSFLHKVSIRNIVRYKKRLFMMLLGVGGCTALIVAGLGLRDSISTVVDDQFRGVTHYQIAVTFVSPMDEAQQQAFREKYADEMTQCIFVHAAAYEARLRQKLEAVLAATDIDESRIIAEAAIYADHVAVDEETVRLRSHIAQLRQMLESGSPVGRKADFLIQEFNREANTIGSKCNDITIARDVVALKAEVEKIREQVQNIE